MWILKPSPQFSESQEPPSSLCEGGGWGGGGWGLTRVRKEAPRIFGAVKPLFNNRVIPAEIHLLHCSILLTEVFPPGGKKVPETRSWIKCYMSRKMEARKILKAPPSFTEGAKNWWSQRLWLAKLQRDFSDCQVVCRELQRHSFVNHRLGFLSVQLLLRYPCPRKQPLTCMPAPAAGKTYWSTKLNLGAIITFICCGFSF